MQYHNFRWLKISRHANCLEDEDDDWSIFSAPTANIHCVFLPFILLIWYPMMFFSFRLGKNSFYMPLPNTPTQILLNYYYNVRYLWISQFIFHFNICNFNASFSILKFNNLESLISIVPNVCSFRYSYFRWTLVTPQLCLQWFFNLKIF